jgi:hypothetical protein
LLDVFDPLEEFVDDDELVVLFNSDPSADEMVLMMLLIFGFQHVPD